MIDTRGPDWLDAARRVAVSGLQWGDEGKGKVVDWLAGHFHSVVRYNGGANAGHTVVVGGKRYALHLVPCGILHPGSINVVGNGCVLDADVLIDEIDELESAGVAVEGRLWVSDRAHVVFEHHKRADGLYEAAVAHSAGDERKIGTTGRGIGPAYADKALRSTAIRVSDLLREDRIDAKARHVALVTNATMEGLAGAIGSHWQPVEPGALADRCRRWGAELAPYVVDTGALLRAAIAEDRSVLFEGANAALLDVDHGTYPYVTSSHTTALGIHPGAGVPGGVLDEVIGVVKAYGTRVGAGPFPTERDDGVGARLRDRGNEYGTTTGRPRRCGWLDLVAVRYTARLTGATRLAVMLLDVLSGFETLEVCVGYRHGAERLTTFPALADTLAEVEPVYESLVGWDADITGCREVDELPDAARDYLRFVEEFVGVPVTIASVGPDRSQTIVLD